MNEDSRALMLAEWIEATTVDSDDHRYLDCAKELRRLRIEVDKLSAMMHYCSHCSSAPGEACTFFVVDGKEIKHERC